MSATKEEIKEAYHVFIEEIIKETPTLSEEVGNNLVTCYCMMDLFLEDDEAQRLNDALALSKDKASYNDPEKSALIREAVRIYASSVRNGDDFDVINQHIGECYNKYPKKKKFDFW